MTPEQKTNIIFLVRDHFAQATDGDCRLVWEGVKQYGFDDARGAIEAHRLEKGDKAFRPNPQRVRAMTCTLYRNRQRQERNAQTVAELIRRQDQEGEYRDLSDIEMITVYFGRAWQNVPESDVDPGGRAAARACILSHARRALVEVGASAADADAYARDCVDLGPGEKVVTPGIFQAMPAGGKPAYLAARELMATP